MHSVDVLLSTYEVWNVIRYYEGYETTVKDGYSNCPHFADKNTKAQKS